MSVTEECVLDRAAVQLPKHSCTIFSSVSAARSHLGLLWLLKCLLGLAKHSRDDRFWSSASTLYFNIVFFITDNDLKYALLVLWGYVSSC